MLYARLGCQESAVKVNCQHLFLIGEGKLLNRVDNLNAGIRGEDVNPAERIHRLLDASVDRPSGYRRCCPRRSGAEFGAWR
jgi:hypothetical protein